MMKTTSSQLLPPPGLEATMPTGLTIPQRIALWIDLVDATDELVKVGLRRKLGPDADIDRAFQEWYDRQRDEHDRAVVHMMREIRRKQELPGESHGG